jgi:hypothetical protein
MRGGAVEQGEGLVREYLLNLVREFEREKVISILGVLKFLFDDLGENSNLLLLFTIWGFSFLEILRRTPND